MKTKYVSKKVATFLILAMLLIPAGVVYFIPDRWKGIALICMAVIIVIHNFVELGKFLWKKFYKQ